MLKYFKYCKRDFMRSFERIVEYLGGKKSTFFFSLLNYASGCGENEILYSRDQNLDQKMMNCSKNELIKK